MDLRYGHPCAQFVFPLENEGVDALCRTSDVGTDAFNSGEVVFGALVVSRCDAAEVLDAIEEALDQVALSVDPAWESEALLAVRVRRDVRPSALSAATSRMELLS